ncbi:MAG: hypothetical protein OXL39_18715 [Caldilineaceae bacterium]|nr:hypothetical protein [Caldilineaceae bacterium]
MSNGILEHGANGKIRRLTLLKKLEFSPSSSRTRNIISSSFKYGFTNGSFNAPTLEITENGHALLELEPSSPRKRSVQFDLAIKRIEPFSKLYERLKGSKLPDVSVVGDEFEDEGVTKEQKELAAKIFVANLRFIGLVSEISGSEYIDELDDFYSDDFLVDATENDDERMGVFPPDTPVEIAENSEGKGASAVSTNRPALHIDIQVHIDAKSSAEQIDHIFASMARHFYGNET